MYIAVMSRLQKWMEKTGETDLSLSQKLGISRVQVSRIRRGVNGASKATAQKIHALTGIPWPTFIEPQGESEGAAA
jgi:transcriptional regulator with XRE-family HTH domain